MKVAHHFIIESLFIRCANKGEFEPACKDFRQALALNASHRNACKYLMETLVERGKMYVEVFWTLILFLNVA